MPFFELYSFFMRVIAGLAICLALMQAISVPKELEMTEATILTLNYEDAFISVRTVDTQEVIIVPIGLIAAHRSELRVGLHVKLEIFQHNGEDKFGRNIIVLPNQ